MKGMMGLQTGEDGALEHLLTVPPSWAYREEQEHNLFLSLSLSLSLPLFLPHSVSTAFSCSLLSHFAFQSRLCTLNFALKNNNSHFCLRWSQGLGVAIVTLSGGV